jgi:hypothetical protein
VDDIEGVTVPTCAIHAKAYRRNTDTWKETALRAAHTVDVEAWKAVKRTTDALAYIKGIVERGIGHPLEDDVSIENAVLNYVKSLEATARGREFTRISAFEIDRPSAVSEGKEVSMKTICVMPRGWILVGNLEGSTLRNAKVIRQWRTTVGLGELAANGPTPSTKLDDLAGEVSIGAPIFTLPAAGWM